MKYLLILAISFFNLTASDAFITPSELKKSLEDKNLIMIDVAESSIYKISHIKGAINADISKFINKENLFSLMNPAEIIQNELKALGINSNSKIVIYSHNTKIGILNSSYLAFILIYSGFENISLLNGGYMAWIFENELLTSSLTPDAKEYGDFIIKINPNILASCEMVQDNLASITMLDARSPQKYYGVERSDRVAALGHISYAKSSFYMNKFLRDSSLREQKELDKIYINGYGLNSSDEIIVYSDSALGASMEFYILYKEMGFKNTKIYEASLLEWGNSLGLPMTRFKWE